MTAVGDMPHVIVCRYTPWAENEKRIPSTLKLKLLAKHMMYRMVVWNGTPGMLKAGDIAIVSESMPPGTIADELDRLRKVGCRCAVTPYLALIADLGVQ